MPDTFGPAAAHSAAIPPEPGLFERAHVLAPQPDEDGTVDDWVRHYAAEALAAHAVFRSMLPSVSHNPVPGSRPELGYVIHQAHAATAAAVALTTPTDQVARKLWDLTPEAGALNGEYLEWLEDTLDGLGINPGDIDPAYNTADFRSPSRAPIRV